jgi:hypothetical protein
MFLGGFMFRWFSKLGNSHERQLHRLYEDAKRETEREYAPLADLSMIIATSAERCTAQIKRYLSIPDEEKIHGGEIYIFFENVYFFVHIAMSEAGLLLPERQAKKVFEYVFEIIPPASVDKFCAHWPEEIKRKMTNEFIQKLNQSGAEFAQTARGTTGNYQDKIQALIILHGQHIVQLCQREAEWNDLKVGLLNIITNALVSAQFERSIQKIGHTN